MVTSETPTPEHQFQHFMDMAKTLPKVDPADPRVDVYRAAMDAGDVWFEGIPFGGTYKNNFYRLFTFYKDVDIDKPKDTITAMILAATLKPVRDQWQAFVDQNPELLEEIGVALKGMFDAEKLEKYVYKLKYSKEDSDIEKFNQLNKVIGHPIGAHAYHAAAGDKLNPLLEKADQAMQALGIDTTPFTSIK